MSITTRITLSCLLFTAMSFSLLGQCESWVGADNKDEGENAHSIYRQALKGNDFTTAFEYWQQAYAIAPAADGKRDYHYLDGVKIYVHLWQNETRKIVHIIMCTIIFGPCARTHWTHPSAPGADPFGLLYVGLAPDAFRPVHLEPGPGPFGHSQAGQCWSIHVKRVAFLDKKTCWHILYSKGRCLETSFR